MNLLQNFRAEASRIHYYVFDLLRWRERDLTRLPLIERRALLKGLLVVQDKRIRIADYVEAAPRDLLAAVREQGLEGIIGKQKDSHYNRESRAALGSNIVCIEDKSSSSAGISPDRMALTH